MSFTIRLKILGACCTFFIFTHQIVAQSSASPYSALGLGDFNYAGLTQNQGMAGMGISFGTGWGVNYMNPALSTRNTIFNFQAALNYQRINLTTNTQRETVDGGGLSYVAMSLPVKSGKSTIGLGMNQITSVNYSILITGDVTNSNLRSLNRIDGEGGISEAYISSGFIVAKNLSLGIHGSYLFGSTLRTNRLSVLNEEGLPLGGSSEYFERFTVSDVTFKGGLHYLLNIGDKNALHFGATYQAFGNIRGKDFAKIGGAGASLIPGAEGDIIRDNESGSVFIPHNLGFGLSYEKINKFVIGLEAQTQNFSQYRSFTGEGGGLEDSFRIALGGQIVPDYSSIDNMFKRSTFRFGIVYHETPFMVRDIQVNDLGISFGGSVPLNALSLMNFAVKLGRRGALTNGLILENYVGFTLGFSLNDNTWFYKRVFE